MKPPKFATVDEAEAWMAQLLVDEERRANERSQERISAAGPRHPMRRLPPMRQALTSPAVTLTIKEPGKATEYMVDRVMRLDAQQEHQPVYDVLGVQRSVPTQMRYTVVVPGDAPVRTQTGPLGVLFADLLPVLGDVEIAVDGTARVVGRVIDWRYDFATELATLELVDP